MAAHGVGIRQRLARNFRADTDEPVPPSRFQRRDALILLAAIAAATSFVLIEGRGNTYLTDEQIILSSTINLEPDTLATPHHGSLMAGTRAVFYAVSSIFGADAYWLLRIIGYLGVVVSAVLLYLVARPRLGSTLALAPALVILAFGTSWDVLLVPLNGVFWAWAVAFGIAAFLLIEREDLLGDLLAVVCLLAAIACGTVGVPFAVGAAVYALLRSQRLSRAWVFAVPLLAYAAWWLWARKFHQTPVQSENVLLVPAYAIDSLGNAWAAILGLNVSVGDHAEGNVAPTFDYAWAPVLAAIAALALGVRLWIGSVPRSLWGFLAALVAFWGLSALTASTPELRTADASRYLYAVVALVLLVTVDALRGLRLHQATVVAIFVVLAIALPASLFHLVDARGYLSDDSREMKTQLRMIELAGQNADPAYVPGLESSDASPLQLIISAGAYLDTVDRVGSWAYSTEEVKAQENETREAADVVLATALRLELEPIDSPRDADGCRTVEPDEEGVVKSELPPGGAVLEASEGGDVLLGRFGDEPSASVGSATGGSAYALEIPEDAATEEWVVSVASAAPVTICSPGESGTAS
jgi:hypothetical protein